jgi:hypothetical protein
MTCVGPIVGGEMTPNDVDVPRAASLDYFSEVCSKEELYIINGNDIYPEIHLQK